MNIHFLQHVAFEGPGYILQWAENHVHQISFTRFYETDDNLPDANAIDVLVIMGGPMSVNDEELFPWLNTEKAFIRQCIDQGKKVLGICLGAQLIAAALGAKVTKAAYKEIGWFPVTPTAVCSEVDWFYDFFRHDPVVFHWHGEQFEIPSGCLCLLSSKANINQAFIYQQNVIGLQFHPEVNKAEVVNMIRHCREDLDNLPYIQPVWQQIDGCKHISTSQRLMDGILNQFLIPVNK